MFAAAAVWVYAGTVVVCCEALAVTLVHRILKSATVGCSQGGNVRGDEEEGKREKKQTIYA